MKPERGFSNTEGPMGNVKRTFQLSPENLHNLTSTFSEGEEGRKSKELIRKGIPCEEQPIMGRKCDNLAQVSIGWKGGPFEDNILVCNDEGTVRNVVNRIDADLRAEGYESHITINGHSMP